MEAHHRGVRWPAVQAMRKSTRVVGREHDQARWAKKRWLMQLAMMDFMTVKMRMRMQVKGRDRRSAPRVKSRYTMGKGMTHQ